MAKKAQPVGYNSTHTVPLAAPRSCATCEYWKRGFRTADGTAWTTHSEAGDLLSIGVCRVNAPTVLAVPAPQGSVNISSFWPFAHEGDWCGNFAMAWAAPDVVLHDA